MALDRGRQPGCRLPAGPAHGRGGLFDGGHGHDPLLLQLLHPLRRGSEALPTGFERRPRTPGRRTTAHRTCGKLPEQSPSGPDLVEALGILDDGVRRQAGVGRGLVQLGRHRPQPGLDIGERACGHRWTRWPGRPRRPPPRRHGGRRGPPPPPGGGRRPRPAGSSSASRASSSSGPVSPAPSSSPTWKASRSISRARPGRRRRGRPGRRRPPPPGPGRPPAAPRSIRAEAVERRPLHPPAEE